MTPTTPAGKAELLVIASVALIVRANCTEAAAPFASFTCRVKSEVPGVVGVPLICPLAGFSVMPAGKAPAVMVQT